MIRLDNISWYAGGSRDRSRSVPLLHAVSCTLAPATFHIVLGPNGAGKSTLLRILSGEKRPHRGKVFFGDRDLSVLSIRELSLRRAVMTQQLSVSLPFTVEEVVMMGRYPHYAKGPGAEDRSLVARALEEMGAGHLALRLFSTLSGGEQQRVQLARVLTQLRGGPLSSGQKLLLLDEPTASMDYLHQQLTLQKARDLSREGYTVVAVLHDLNLAAQFADHLLLLKEGHLLAAGAPQEILQPALIRQAYGVDVTVFVPDGYGYSVILPAPHYITHKY